MRYESPNKKNNEIESENIYYNINEYDLRELELLNLQIKSIIIFTISDIIFYDSIIGRIEFICNKEDDSYIQKLQEEEIKAVYLELISKIILLEVDIKRDKNLYERFMKGEIKFSFEPNMNITGADKFAVLTYFFLLIGVIAVYKRNVIEILSIDSEKQLQLLNRQLEAINIRLYADYFAYISTKESIDLIYDKYRKKKNRKINPDIAAVQSAELYLLSRIIFANVNFTISNELYKKYGNANERYLLQANITINVANIFGIISCIYVLIGVIGIYNRNMESPIFGI